MPRVRGCIKRVRAALATGMLCVGVQTGRLADRPVAEGVHQVIPDLSALRLDVPRDQPQLRLPSSFTFGLVSKFDESMRRELRRPRP
jgi:hypothetical protein